MIRLGLSRAAQLWKNAAQPWKVVHVAGTNGKGSICAYTSALLQAAGVRCGRFTSPHLIDRWDCIHVDNRPVTKELFEHFERRVLDRNENENIGATPFEILTVTAFEIFTHENVSVGVVETGMGGRDDATNILQNKAVTVISRVGLDHQKFLGDTIEEIALHKCGIFRPNVPVIYDATNPPSVVSVIEKEAKRVDAKPLVPKVWLRRAVGSKFRKFARSLYFQKPQRVNIACAYGAVEELLPQLGIPFKKDHELQLRLEDSVIHTQTAGRMQSVNLVNLLDRGTDRLVLVDGAHNLDAITSLEMYVRNALRAGKRSPKASGWRDYQPIVWVLAFSKGRDFAGMIDVLIQEGDSVAVVEFGPVDGMPWVEPQPCSDIQQAIEAKNVRNLRTFGKDVGAALKWAANLTADDRIVVTGSLYLVSDVLRLLRDADGKKGAKPTTNCYDLCTINPKPKPLRRRRNSRKTKDSCTSKI